MKRYVFWLSLAFAVGIVSPAVSADKKQMLPPPALHVPFGGRIVTDVNVADNNVLGVVREILPDVVNAAKTVMEQKEDSMPASMPALDAIDVKPLLESISGVKNVRVLVVKYGPKATAARVLAQADAGVSKTGRFCRLATQMGGGMIAVYSQEDGGGFVGFAYDSKDHTLVAARIVGPVDLIKLMQWASGLGIRISAPAQEVSAVEPQN